MSSNFDKSCDKTDEKLEKELHGRTTEQLSGSLNNLRAVLRRNHGWKEGNRDKCVRRIAKIEQELRRREGDVSARWLRTVSCLSTKSGSETYVCTSGLRVP
jgi:hypothetical protein